MPGCRSLTRLERRRGGGGRTREEEAAVHLEPAKHIPADVTSRGVAGKQGGRHTRGECVCVRVLGVGRGCVEGGVG